MKIWIAFIIPVLTLLFLLVKYRKNLVLWEVLLLLGIPAIILGIEYAVVTKSQLHDIEFWGSYTQKATYYEHWNEYIYKTCTRTYPCGTDSDGNTDYCTETYDCSYVDDHSPYWEIEGSGDEQIWVSQQHWDKLCSQFGNKSFQDMKRNYHTIDGDAYVTFWKGEPEKIDPITTEHNYENRIKVSQSVYSYKPVDPKVFGLYSYPSISGYYQPTVLGQLGPEYLDGIKRMEYINASLGAMKRIKVFLLIFRDKPMEAGIEQESYWKGSNKNELVICVGLDGTNNVQWCHVFSWSKVESLKVDIKNFIIGQGKLDLLGFATWLEPEIKKRWAKRNWHDFDYLSVELPLSAMIWALILSTLSSIGLALFVVNNEFTEDNPDGRFYFRS